MGCHPNINLDRKYRIEESIENLQRKLSKAQIYNIKLKFSHIISEPTGKFTKFNENGVSQVSPTEARV